MSETAAPQKSALKGPKARVLAAIGVILALVLVLSRLKHGGEYQHLTVKVERGDIRDAVEATGTINAVTTVQVGSQVSGTIAKLNADFNSRVHTGEIIALIDPRLFEGALKQAISDLEDSRANVLVSEANVTKARAALVQTRADFGRAEAMRNQGVEAEQALDLAKANYESAKASVDAAVANVAQAKAQVGQKEAAVSVAKTNLAYTVIRSPIDGIVVARNVDVGQTVAASLQAPTVFTIAQDLTQMYVYAKVDESDVGRIKAGRQVTFKVDAFPKEVFTGRINQVRMNATLVQNVVTYDVVVEFRNRDEKLFPGMTCYVTIPVAAVSNVIKIPNAALRYKPPMSPESVRSAYAKYGVHDDAGAGHETRESAVVWKRFSDGHLEPVRIALGITDHAWTEVTQSLSGKLDPGDEVVTSSVPSKSLPPGAQGIRR